jgi:hypothetical protein
MTSVGVVYADDPNVHRGLVVVVLVEIGLVRSSAVLE